MRRQGGPVPPSPCMPRQGREVWGGARLPRLVVRGIQIKHIRTTLPSGQHRLQMAPLRVGLTGTSLFPQATGALGGVTDPPLAHFKCAGGVASGPAWGEAGKGRVWSGGPTAPSPPLPPKVGTAADWLDVAGGACVARLTTTSLSQNGWMCEWDQSSHHMQKVGAPPGPTKAEE